MPYTSPGESIVSGIQAGQAYMERAQQENDRQEQLRLQRQREDRLDRMQQAHIDWMERNETDKQQHQYKVDALGAMRDEANDLHAKYAAVIDQYGGDPNKVPPEVQAQFSDSFNDWNSRQMALRRSIYGNFLNQQQDRATAHSKDLQAGNADPTDPDNADDLVHTLAVSTHRDPADFLKVGDQPSRVEQGISDFHQAMSNNDPQQMSKAMGTILGPQLEAGRLGMLDPTGGTITGVGPNEDRPIVPTPDGKSFHPVLSITAQHPNGYVSTQPYAAPTEGDSGDLITMTPQKAFDYVGQLGTMQSAVSHPDVQANIHSALQNPDQQTLDAAHAYTALGNIVGKKGGGSLEKLKNADGSEHLYFVSNDGSTTRDITPAGLAGTKPEKEPTEATLKEQHLQSLLGQPKPGGGAYTQQDLDAIGAGIKAPPDEFSKVNPETLHRFQREDAQDQAMLGQGMVPDGLGGYRKGSPDEVKAWTAGINARSGVQPPGSVGITGAPSQPTVPGSAQPPDKATNDAVTKILQHAQQDPTAQGKSAGMIIEGAIRRGLLPPSARQLVGNAGDQPIGPTGNNWGAAQPGNPTMPARQPNAAAPAPADW